MFTDYGVLCLYIALMQHIPMIIKHAIETFSNTKLFDISIFLGGIPNVMFDSVSLRHRGAV